MDGSDFIHHLLENRITIVTGIAGQGKSMLLRKVFCDLCVVNHSVVPIFPELRDISCESESLLEFAYETIYQSNEIYPLGSFRNLLKSGKIIPMLDGLDEIAPKGRRAALKQIDKLGRDFRKLHVIVTTRPIEVARSWSQARVYEINKFSESQIEELVTIAN